MKDINKVEYYQPAEKLAKILMKKTQNNDPLFFRVLVAYYFTKVASMMRCNIRTHDRGSIPVSMYALNLATSGQGKGHSTNIVEEQVISQFRQKFLQDTFPIISMKKLSDIAATRAIRNNTEHEEEMEKIEKEFEGLGTLAFSFDSGTTAAVKQMRHKLLMANAGSMNMEIDEIGSNLIGNVEVLNTFLELFDVGKVKQKLTKNTKENVRSEEIDGRTPTNMMLFGTPAKLLNGGKVEEEFYAMLETGYARRCIFGYSKGAEKNLDLTPEEIYDILTDTASTTYIQELSHKLGQLADISNFNTSLKMTKEVSLLFIEYKLNCDKKAKTYADHEEIKKAEISHRYFKALKLSGAYAFIDSSADITMAHAYSAIKLVEASGDSFMKILTRDKNYAKLAYYIAAIGREVTHVDLIEDLPFYKGSEAHRKEMMQHAIAFGYKNNIIIKKQYTDGIEFLTGESLKKTDPDKMVVSYSTDITTGYTNQTAAFKELHKLTQMNNYHWVAHHLKDGYRNEEHCLSGFNLCVIDVDEGVNIATARLLLKDYSYLLYTTKRHTTKANRFRIVFPLNYTLKMSKEDYKDFMSNVYSWLPFDVDKQTNQRSRKWLSNDGNYYYNDGEMLDALLFIPKTKKADVRKQIINDQQSLSNIERWVMNNTDTGNRSNMLIRYAYLLVDTGMDLDNIRYNVLALNDKLPDKLPEGEILSTVIISAGKKIHLRDTK